LGDKRQLKNPWPVDDVPIDDLNACYQRQPIPGIPGNSRTWKTPLTWTESQGPPIRTFATGATRDTEDGKPDFEGFLSPLVIEAYGDYMQRHRVQADGNLRDSDNWQLGQPKNVYIKSAWRHLIDLWKEHRGHASRDGIDEALGGLLFNIMGYWLEYLRERGVE